MNYFKSPAFLYKIILFAVLCVNNSINAIAQLQYPLFPEGSKIITFNIGLFNHYRFDTKNKLRFISESFNDPKDSGYDYKLTMSNPLTLGIEYAYKDNITIAASLSYFTIAGVEDYQTIMEDGSTTIKGMYLALSLKAYKYIFEDADYSFYIIGGGGIKIRSISFTSDIDNAKNISLIYNTPLISGNGFSPFFWEAGLGMKWRVTDKMGIMTEFVRSPEWLRLGLFYRLLEKSYRKRDKIGW